MKGVDGPCDLSGAAVPDSAGDLLRGRAGWFMQVSDVKIGHEVLGFDYPMSADARPVP